MKNCKQTNKSGMFLIFCYEIFTFQKMIMTTMFLQLSDERSTTITIALLNASINFSHCQYENNIAISYIIEPSECPKMTGSIFFPLLKVFRVARLKSRKIEIVGNLKDSN